MEAASAAAITISPHLKSPGGPRDCINSLDRIQNTGRRVYTDGARWFAGVGCVCIVFSRLLSRISIRIQRVHDPRINRRPGESRLKSCTMITRPTLECWNIVINDWKPRRGEGERREEEEEEEGAPNRSPIRWFSRGEKLSGKGLYGGPRCETCRRNLSFDLSFVSFLFFVISYSYSSYSWFWEERRGIAEFELI